MKTKGMTEAVAVLSDCGYWYAGIRVPYLVHAKANPEVGVFLTARGYGTHATLCSFEAGIQFFLAKNIA